MSEPRGLGEFLRHEREKRGLTIEQIATATKINVKLLHSLESDQYADLPAKPFVRGFIASYSRFIGLDAQDVWTRFQSFVEERTRAHEPQNDRHTGYAFEKKEVDSNRMALWIVMGVFVAVGGLLIVLLKPSFRHKEMTAVDELKQAHSTDTEPAASQTSPHLTNGTETPATASPTPTATQANKPQANASPTPAEPENTKPVPSATVEDGEGEESSDDPLRKGDLLKADEVKRKVVLKTLANVWIRYRVDDHPEMKILLPEGRLIVFKAKEKIRIQVSNKSSVQMKEGWGPYKAWPSDENTLFFPKTLSENSEEISFKNNQLPETPNPTPSAAPSGVSGQ